MVMFVQAQMEKTTTEQLKVELNNKQLYHGLWISCQQVKGAAAVSFLLWTLANLEVNNIFTFNDEYMDRYSADMEKNMGYSYKRFTIEDALRELLRVKAIEKLSRGSYKVSPWVTLGVDPSQYGGVNIASAKEVLKQSRDSRIVGLTLESGSTDEYMATPAERDLAFLNDLDKVIPGSNEITLDKHPIKGVNETFKNKRLPIPVVNKELLKEYGHPDFVPNTIPLSGKRSGSIFENDDIFDV